MTQSEALRILATGANAFLTGEPGAGKTHTVNAYVSWLRSHGIEPAITASTGIAATHIGGMTIHAWSGIGVREFLSANDLDFIASKEHVVRRIVKTNVLIIDEISMLSGEVLSMVDEVAREVRHSSRPFGGMQVVFVGDFFQLPPVSRKGSDASFAFESGAWQKANPLPLYLDEQHRQEGGALLRILSSIRLGTCDQSDISHILSRECEPDGIPDEIPRLYTHNADVDRINAEKLAGIKSTAKVFRMEGSGAPVLIESLKRGCLSPEELHLKEGASVMFTKNNSLAGFSNGTLGTVTGFERGTGLPVVELRDGREITVNIDEWAIEEAGKPRAKVRQVPLRLAWAITVHKSQGQSLDAAAIDLSRAFEYGQGYVALSRLRTLEGLHLLGWHENALAIHPRVTSKDEEFLEASQQATEVFSTLEESGERGELEKRFILASGGTLETSEPGPKEKKNTYDATLALLVDNKPVLLVVKERGLTYGTIAGHIEKLIEGGKLEREQVRPLLPARLREALPDIFEAFETVGAEKLTPVFAHCKERYTFDDLKLARALYEP